MYGTDANTRCRHRLLRSAMPAELSFRHYNLHGKAIQIALSLIHNVKDRSHRPWAVETRSQSGTSNSPTPIPVVVHGINPQAGTPP
jgi:hypothetical protein